VTLTRGTPCIRGVIDCNEWKTEKRHKCANMGKVKRLELWRQLYHMSLPVQDLENFRPMDFCSTVYQHFKVIGCPELQSRRETSHYLLYLPTYMASYRVSQNLLWDLITNKWTITTTNWLILCIHVQYINMEAICGSAYIRTIFKFFGYLS